MQELGPAPPTASLSDAEVLAQYGKSIEQVLKAAQEPEYESERTIQINKARRNWQFVKGNHYLIPGLVDGPNGQMVDYIFDSPSVDDAGGSDVKFNYPINLIGGDLYKYMAVLGNSAPRIKAIADDPQDSDQITQANAADATLRDLFTKWKADQIQRVLAFHQYTTGPCFLRTSWVTDRLKHGQSTEPKMELAPTFLPDGTQTMVPFQTGVTTYPNGEVELHVYSILEAEGPYMAHSMQEMQWFKIQTNRSKWDLLATFASEDPTEPSPLEKYRFDDVPDDDVPASSTLAAEARESVANPSATGRARKQNQWRFGEYWLHPNLYEAVEDPEARKLFQDRYADGMFIAKVGSIKVKLANSKLTDEIAVCKTGRGEKVFDDPICSDAVPIQRALNDLVNLAIETVLRSIAQTIVDSQILNFDKMRKKEAVANELIFTTMPPDGNLTDHIAQLPQSRVSDQLVPLFQMLRTLMQDITGIRPELSGGGQPTSTYREAKQRKDQALLQLSPQADAVQAAWVDAGPNGVKVRSRYASGLTKVPKQGAFGDETDVVDNARLSESGWHGEADDNFPMNSADRFDKMWALLKEFPPEVQQALSILDPLNLEETLELLQIPGFESVAEGQKIKTLGDVKLLMAGQVIPGQPGPPGPDGQPGPPGPDQSSLPIDPWDDSKFITQFMPVWMNSKTGQGQKATNPNGFQNVVAFWQAHKAISNPPPPPPPPPVRAALNLSGKLEDLGPQILNEALQGAGLGAVNPASVPAPPPPAPPKGQPQPKQLDSPESPLPPVPTLDHVAQGPTTFQ